MTKVGMTFAAALLLATNAAEAQEIPRGIYLRHLPLGIPRLAPRTSASETLEIWGDTSDPGYRDVAPADGIDDGRHDLLQALAVRFAPFLVQNTDNFPMNFRTFMENRSTFPLFVDTWDVSGEEQTLVGTREVNFSALGQGACGGAGSTGAFSRSPLATTDGVLEDCKLLELMEEFTPGSGETSSRDASLIRGEPTLVNVLFFNFPGEGAKTWEVAYEPEYERTPEARRRFVPHAFVHPFAAVVQDDEGRALGYELVLQYWFFYPSNDHGMDHEGDWEHINVVVSPRSQVEEALSEETVQRMLRGEIPATDDAADPLVIKRVDYYFHELVWPLDFSSPNVYLPREAWEADLASRRQEQFREKEIWRALRYMAYRDDAETRINTHPFGYIGGDNKGLNQALEGIGGGNRDPHGTYPFPGRYNNVGPGGTTDQLTSYVDSRKYLADLEAGRADKGPDFKKESVLGLADADRLLIVPDWERIVPLARTDPQVRWAWSWLILPVRWGYPATQSPFSGVLANYNTGNVAPQGPSYNLGWNVTGPGAGFFRYQPHSVPSVFPLQLQDNFRNDLGFLNLTVPTLLNLPPLDFLSRLVAYPFRVALGRRDPAYYPKEGVPFRFLGLSSGVSIQVLDQDFDGLALSGAQYEPFVGFLLGHLIAAGMTDQTSVTGGESYKRNSVGPFIQIPFYLGGRFTSENTVRNTRATFGLDMDFSDLPSYHYRHDLNYWEYAGSIRYSLSTSHVQPFVKGGYGWSWYRLENISGDGLPFPTPQTAWTGPDNVLPNVWHYGLGVEFIPWKRVGAFSEGLDMALRLEYTRYTQHLAYDFSSIPFSELGLIFTSIDELPGRDRVVRNDFIIGLTVTF